jgi:hypothetical protein
VWLSLRIIGIMASETVYKNGIRQDEKPFCNETEDREERRASMSQWPDEDQPL